MTIISSDYSNYNSFNEKKEVSSPIEQKEENSVFDKMNQWTDAHINNMKQASESYNEAANNLAQASALLDQIEDPQKKAEFAAKLEQLQALEEECAKQIDEEYQKNQEEIGTTFDFMEGKDVNNEEEYNAQLLKLAQADVESRDIDGDGKINLQEYVFSEVGSTDQYESEELLKTAVTNSILSFYIIDNKMGASDGSEDLSVAEFQSMYKNLDGFLGAENVKEDGTATGNFDGKFEIGKSDEMFSYLIDEIFSEEKYNKTKELSLDLLRNY